MDEQGFQLKNIEGFKEIAEKLAASSDRRAKEILNSISPKTIDGVGVVLPVLDNDKNIYYSIKYSDEFKEITNEIFSLLYASYIRSYNMPTTQEEEGNIEFQSKYENSYAKAILNSNLGEREKIYNLINHLGLGKTVKLFFPDINTIAMGIGSIKNFAEKFIKTYDLMKTVNEKIKNSDIELALNKYSDIYGKANEALQTLKEKNSQTFNYNDIVSSIQEESGDEVKDKLEFVKNPTTLKSAELTKAAEILLDILKEEDIVINNILMNLDSKSKYELTDSAMKTLENDKNKIIELTKKLLFQLDIGFNPNTIKRENIYKAWEKGLELNGHMVYPVKTMTQLVLEKLIDTIYDNVESTINTINKQLEKAVTDDIVSKGRIDKNSISELFPTGIGVDYKNKYILKYIEKKVNEFKSQIHENLLFLLKNPEKLEIFINNIKKQEKNTQEEVLEINSTERLLENIILMSQYQNTEMYDKIKNSIISYSKENGYLYLKNEIILDNIIKAIDGLSLKEIKNLLTLNMQKDERFILTRIYNYIARKKFK